MAGETDHSPAAAVLSAPGLRPEATAAELSLLATHDDALVRAAVAAHPNTPAPLLGKLAAEFPAQVLRNPALALLRLAHPRLLHSWPDEALLALLRLPEAPDWLRHHAAKSSAVEVQVALATHPGLSQAEIERLVTHPAWLVRARLAARTDLSAALLAHLTSDPDYGVRLAVASRPDLPESSIATLRHDPSRFVRQVLEQTLRSGLAAFLFLLCLPG